MLFHPHVNNRFSVAHRLGVSRRGSPDDWGPLRMGTSRTSLCLVIIPSGKLT